MNVNTDALQKIERFLIQPDMVKIITGRFSSPEKTPNWRSLFLSSGFLPLTFSNFTESQAECVVKRTPVRGFHIERRQSSLVLCWQRKELISASAWKCWGAESRLLIRLPLSLRRRCLLSLLTYCVVSHFLFLWKLIVCELWFPFMLVVTEPDLFSDWNVECYV